MPFDIGHLTSIGLVGYTLFRRDRSDKNSRGETRKGGGMILAIKTSLNATLEIDYKDQFMAVNFTRQFNCSECAGSTQKTYSFGLLYRRKQPYRAGQTRNEFNQESQELWGYHISRFLLTLPLHSGTVFVGDFNFDIWIEQPDNNDLPWNDPGSTAFRTALGVPIYKGFNKLMPSAHEKGLFETIETAGMDQLVEDATHTDGNILDLIFGTPGFVKDIQNRGNISVNSVKQDHCILTFKLYLGDDCDRQ